MSRYFLSATALLATAVAQTWTACNPLNETCPLDPALGTTYAEDLTQDVHEFNPNLWNITAGADLITFSDSGASLPISKKGDTITVKSNFYIFWGQLEIVMQAAPGKGIISTAILLSDDLDEIDWEIIGSNTSYVENNYYGWGNTSQYNAKYEPLENAQQGFHNYTIDWTQERIQYYIDGNVVRTLPYDVPGKYPQTPCFVSFGIWAAGDSDQNGTVQWAGGKTDYSQAPFVMQVKSIRVTDGTSNSSTYAYKDHTGSYQSIEIAPGQSEAYKFLNKQTTVEHAQQKWNGLSTGAKIGIACGVLGGFAIAVIAFTAYCIVQRKRGRAEKALADKAWDEHTNELNEYKTMMARGDFAVNHMGHGEQRF